MENFFRAVLDVLITVADTIVNIFVGLGRVISFNFKTFEIFFSFAGALPEVILAFGMVGLAIGVIFLIVGR